MIEMVKVGGEVPIEFFWWFQEQVKKVREEVQAFNDKNANDLWEMLCAVDIGVLD